MAGLLDLIAAGQAGASPFNALYPSPLYGALPVATGQAPAAPDAAAYGALGIDPSALALPTPPVDPFPKQAQPTAPPIGDFGKGAIPFGFAGPGSMNVSPSDIAPPAPAFGADAKPVPFAAAPVVQQPGASPATDVSSANKPNRAPGDYISVGNYQMPAFRGGAAASDDEEDAPQAAVSRPSAPVAAARPGAAPFSFAGAGGGAGDRLMKATRGFLGNLSAGPIGALAGGLGALVTNQETDPSAIAQGKMNATGQALLAKGASMPEVQAAIGNPALMGELVKQYFGPKTVTLLGEGYVWDARAGKAVKAYDPRSKIGDDIAERKAAAAAAGLKPSDPAYNSFVMAGKWPKENEQPLTAGDKKAIQDADERILTVRQVIDNLNNAKKLSKQSYDGALASQRGWVGSNVGLDSGTNTADLENLVTGNALGQLKAIFGGNPTEGERKILLEVQGSVNQPDAVRQRIWDRAIAAAQLRLSMEEQRSNELRGGTFYKQGGGMSGTRAQPPGGTVNVGGQAINWSVK